MAQVDLDELIRGFGMMHMNYHPTVISSAARNPNVSEYLWIGVSRCARNGARRGGLPVVFFFGNTHLNRGGVVLGEASVAIAVR